MSQFPVFPNLFQHPTSNQQQQQQQNQKPYENQQQQFHYYYNPPCFLQNFVDQVKACTNGSSPIFILPNAVPPTSNNNQFNQPAQQPISPQFLTMPPALFCQPTCFSCPALHMPYHDPYGFRGRESCHPPNQSHNPECCSGKNSANSNETNKPLPSGQNREEPHKCASSPEGTVCAKKNCPASIQLQAMVSQLLSIQGIVSCAMTRIILQRIPGSGVTATIDETMDQAQRAIAQMSKDQLLNESRASMQVNALISLYMNATPLPIVIPILTTVQLKNNVLKSQIEAHINQKIMENQGMGAEAPDKLDALILALKSDCELRQLLASLREKECEERVNINFAPYRSQRFIAETRLANVQSKIEQVEQEMSKRRNNGIPLSPTAFAHLNKDLFCDHQQVGRKIHTPARHDVTHESPKNDLNIPDPYIEICSKNLKKLLLKPHVGSPETTYDKKSNEESNSTPKQTFGHDLENASHNSTSKSESKELGKNVSPEIESSLKSFIDAPECKTSDESEEEESE